MILYQVDTLMVFNENENTLESIEHPAIFANRKTAFDNSETSMDVWRSADKNLYARSTMSPEVLYMLAWNVGLWLGARMKREGAIRLRILYMLAWNWASD